MGFMAHSKVSIYFIGVTKDMVYIRGKDYN